jgi:hypothetical protein
VERERECRGGERVCLRQCDGLSGFVKEAQQPVDCQYLLTLQLTLPILLKAFSEARERHFCVTLIVDDQNDHQKRDGERDSTHQHSEFDLKTRLTSKFAYFQDIV